MAGRDWSLPKGHKFDIGPVPVGLSPPRAPITNTWKQVDAEHADRVARGCLRIGTLSGYTSLENGRADPIDGGISMFSSQPMLKGHPPSDRAMARMGIDAQLAVNVTVDVRQPPAYAFCMSEPGCLFDPSPETPKAIFEISNAVELAYAIVRKYPDLFHRLLVGKVIYAPRTFDVYTQDPEQADPFTKDVRFQQEQKSECCGLRNQESRSLFAQMRTL